MHSTLSWDDLRGRSVGIYGIGIEGRSSLRACRARGIEPWVVDDRPPSEPVDGVEVAATGSGGLARLLACDVVIKSPGISHYSDTVEAIGRHGVEVVGGLGMWMQGADRERVLCVGGTKGKSTTAALLTHLIRTAGFSCYLGGNFGDAPFDPAVPPDFDYWVIEVGSYQSVDFGVTSPRVAITSLAEDHLPWHRNDVECYYRDKLSLCSLPGARVTWANGDSGELRRRRHLLGPRVEWVTLADVDRGPWIDRLALPGAHNRRNAGIAVALAQDLGRPELADDEALGEFVAGFTGLTGRLETVERIGDVAFVDDALATNAMATAAALSSFDSDRVALIVGGQDRGIDYDELVDALRQRGAATRVFTMPDNGPKIGRLIRRALGPDAAEDHPDLTSAVLAAHRWVAPKGVVLHAPGAPSFGRFRNYAERSAAFRQAARQCSPEEDQC